MLGTTLWFVVVIGLVAVALMDGAAAFGRAGVHAAADHALDAAMHDAVADYQNRLQAAGEQTQTPATPLERTLPASADESTPGAAGFTLAYVVTPTTLTAPACLQSGTPSTGPDTIAWLQCGGFVRESRMSLRVVVRVLDAAGNETLARREQYVTLRLFGEPPYSAVVGRKDASANDPTAADALAAPAHEGDVGGDTVSGASPQPQASATPAGQSSWPAGGTLIHVRYECHDGAGRCANAAPPDPDASLRPGTRWANGNRPEL
ncbi:MAG: hypothetical protein M3169_03815 [Candidatus Eremiobacteraeota bacterium]|nr:hypothetical protein [Candidatus Eremiobacteraeota bacterium]